MSKKFTSTEENAPKFQSRVFSKIFNGSLCLALSLLVFVSGCKKDDFTEEIVGLCPVIVTTDPADKAVDVALNKVISITFNTDMNALSINSNTFTIKQGTTVIAGTIAPTASAKTFTFKPDAALLPFITYTGTITTGAKDTLRTAMASDYVWTFTTIPQITVLANPIAGGTVLGAGTFAKGSATTITAIPNSGYTFTSWSGDATGSVNPLTITVNANKNITANFTLNPAGGPVGGPAVGPSAINLGSAGDFQILTKTGISTTGITSVSGDIGVSPAAATAITGFGLIMDTNGQSSHTPIVTGKVYAADYAAPTPAKMTTAVSDMETAFTTANNLVTPAPIVGLYSGDISGRILPPGLYKWSTGVLISNAGVTLTGGPNDTWVFQIAQDLTVNNGAKITLLGGAQAKNIFWIVTGQATLGSNTDFSGIILSKTLISLNTGAKVTGKLLAQTAVTLNASTVVKP